MMRVFMYSFLVNNRDFRASGLENRGYCIIHSMHRRLPRQELESWLVRMHRCNQDFTHSDSSSS